MLLRVCVCVCVCVCVIITHLFCALYPCRFMSHFLLSVCVCRSQGMSWIGRRRGWGGGAAVQHSWGSKFWMDDALPAHSHWVDAKSGWVSPNMTWNVCPGAAAPCPTEHHELLWLWGQTWDIVCPVTFWFTSSTTTYVIIGTVQNWVGHVMRHRQPFVILLHK